MRYPAAALSGPVAMQTGCPRGALKRQIERAAKLGYEMMAGVEAEFFIFHLDKNGNASLETHDSGGYFDLAPADKAEPIRRLIIDDLVTSFTLKKLRLPIPGEPIIKGFEQKDVRGGCCNIDVTSCREKQRGQQKYSENHP